MENPTNKQNQKNKTKQTRKDIEKTAKKDAESKKEIARKQPDATGEPMTRYKVKYSGETFPVIATAADSGNGSAILVIANGDKLELVAQSDVDI